ITLTGGAQWVLGAESADLIAAATIPKSFDIHHRFCYNCDGELAEIEIERSTDVTEFVKKDPSE
ncbi:hypothetical protein LCGC14_0454300, partial [marine sediment metagenome]